MFVHHTSGNVGFSQLWKILCHKPISSWHILLFSLDYSLVMYFCSFFRSEVINQKSWFDLHFFEEILFSICFLWHSSVNCFFYPETITTKFRTVGISEGSPNKHLYSGVLTLSSILNYWSTQWWEESLCSPSYIVINSGQKVSCYSPK